MSFVNRRHFLAAAGALGLSPRFARAQAAYPSRPVRIIVPLPAGGAADVGARLLAAPLQKQLKQSVVIENKPGGIYVIAMQAIAGASADGHTLIALNSGMAAAQVTIKRFDLLRSLSLITCIGRTPTLFVVPAQSRFRSIKELIVHAGAHPGALRYGSVGVGTLEHLWTTEFSRRAGIEATHVPFKGMPDALTALMQGEIDFVPAVYPAALPFVQKGSLRSFGVISDQRVPGMTEIPTLKEQGIDAPPMQFWSGYAAPAGTPAPVIERLRLEIATALRDPATREGFVTRGTHLAATPAEADLEAAIKEDLIWMEATARRADIRVD